MYVHMSDISLLGILDGAKRPLVSIDTLSIHASVRMNLCMYVRLGKSFTVALAAFKEFFVGVGFWERRDGHLKQPAGPGLQNFFQAWCMFFAQYDGYFAERLSILRSLVFEVKAVRRR